MMTDDDDLILILGFPCVYGILDLDIGIQYMQMHSICRDTTTFVFTFMRIYVC